jgi:hypothetical protein
LGELFVPGLGDLRGSLSFSGHFILC